MRLISTSLSLFACVLLASCASSTMDSIPNEAQMQAFQDQARRSFSGEYEYLGEEMRAGRITDKEYQERLASLEQRVTSEAHTLAWRSHQLAELQRQSRGEPTPSAPVAMGIPNAMMGGATGESQFRSALSQYAMGSGLGGGTGGVSGRQLGQPASAGALATPNYPGSIYDSPDNQ
jgi:hypothetical protein